MHDAAIENLQIGEGDVKDEHCQCKIKHKKQPIPGRYGEYRERPGKHPRFQEPAPG